MDDEKSDKIPISPLWEAMVWNRRHGGGKSQQIQELLRKGYNPNEEWDHATWTGEKMPGGCEVPSFSSEDLFYRTSPLFSTIISNDTETALLLLEHGADTERKTQQGMTALQLAVKLMNSGFVRLLISHGANMEATAGDSNARSAITGCFALHHAVLSAQSEMLHDLLELGANVNATTTAGWTALDLAILYQRVEMIEFLSKEYPSLTHEYAQEPHDSLTDQDAIQIEKERQMASELVRTGAQGTSKEHQKVFLECMRQAWSRIEFGVDPTVDIGRIILHEAETALISMAGLTDKISWDQGFCGKCSTFTAQESHLLSKLFEHSSDLSNLQQSALSGCPLCEILSETLTRRLKSEFQKVDHQTTEDCGVYLKVEFSEGYTGSFNGDDLGALVVQWKGEKAKIDLGNVDEQTRTAVFNTGPSDKQGSRSARSLAIAKAWLEHCELHHNKCRGQSLPKLPSRVIAVGDVDGEPLLQSSTENKARYTVLSHGWGGVSSLQTTAANLQQHSREIPFNQMPKTIQDAIIITRALGIQYLWVDALCVVQDSAEDFQQQMALVGDIYANATLTIAAKDASDPTIGCLTQYNRKSTAILPLNFLFPQGGGDKPVRTPRINKAFLIPKLDVPAEREENQVLETRGWALQEKLLSRRILACSDLELSWTCLQRNCSESNPRTATVFASVKKDDDYYARLAMAGESEYSSEPPDSDDLFQTWLNIVEEYSGRQLPSPKDKIFALAGLQSRFATILCDTPLLGGWSHQYLWPSLLWYCESAEQQTVTKQASYPSWAWPSANGPIKFMTHGLGRSSSFDPVVTAWNLNILEPDVKVSGSIRIKCRLLSGSVFDVGKEDFNYRDEFFIGPTFVEQRRFMQMMWEMIEAQEAGDTLNIGEEDTDREKDDRQMEHGEEKTNTYHFMLVASFPRSPPPKYGYPAEPQGMPASALFMVLEKISEDQMHFRKVALYQEWEDDSWRNKLQDATIDLF